MNAKLKERLSGIMEAAITVWILANGQPDTPEKRAACEAYVKRCTTASGIVIEGE